MSGDRDENPGNAGPGDESTAGGDEGVLGAAWGGGGDSDGGPPPRAEDVEPGGVEPRGDDADVAEPSLIDRITVFLQEHKTIFTGAVLLYALLVMPWLYENGYQVVGFVIGAALIGGIVLVTIANVHEARDRLQGGDERRGF